MRSRLVLACLSILALGLLARPVSAQSHDSGLSLLHKMQAALGGANRIAAIRDLDWTAKGTTYDHNGKEIGRVTKRTRWIRPNFLRLDQVGPGDTYVLYFDGRSGWEILPDKPDVRKLVGGELDFAKHYLWGFRLNLWVADQTGGYAISSPSINVIRFRRADMSFDVTVNLRTDLPADPVAWTTVQGVRFPAMLVNSHPNDGSAKGKTVKLLFNTHLDPHTLAAVPADLKPDLGN